MRNRDDLDSRIAAMVEQNMKGYGADNSDYFEIWLATYRQIANEFAHEATREEG